MLKIDRYTFTTSLLFTLFCLLLLIIIESFFTFLNELQDIGDDQYQLVDMIKFLLYDMPARVYRIFPMALLLGTLLGLGQLASHNELTAIRTAGFSKARTLRGAIYTTLLLSAAIVWVGEYIVPPTHEEALVVSHKNSSNKGFWAIDGDYIIEVNSLENLTLKNINVYSSKDQALHKWIKAPEMVLSNNEWVMPSFTEITFNPDIITDQKGQDFALNTHIDKTALNALVNDPEYLSSQDLWRFITYLEQNNLDSSEYRLAFWSKIFNPLINISMILIAAPLVFAQQRRQGIGERILIGVILGLIIYLMTQMLGHFILISGFPPIIGALFPAIFAMLIAYGLFKLLP
ncbi:LPS export ABC transporter permease LptG [Ignatzschineria ureiclastica]|uniref:LPS export ABC transporter permease LptG n=1 Tax=Ignatzschineria ureiclastica TaxID=472582 RepID=A0A2U2AGY4_9GAMM|nr:LPS export ABC transporter permease LptG [Ignatzschineria ureiclastica]PWD81913.1 LPS export ABC transporter permease LptG [Ignatzschineria ureiclastica]GGZ91376.1 LPS export ABC transporter permease LptG [Ignatzschineria ureiclastica]